MMQEHVHDGHCTLRLFAVTMIKTVAAITCYLLDSVSAHSCTAHLRRKGLCDAVLLRHRSLGLALALACFASVSPLVKKEVALRTSFASALKV